MTTTKLEKRGKGRPKSFCREEALAKALKVFCVHGYQGASVSLLTEAMGMKPPSLYAAFGDKESLFLEVLEQYHAPYEAALSTLFEQENLSTIEAIEQLFEMSKTAHACSNATGCLIVNSSIVRQDECDTISGKIKALHDLNEKLIFLRLQKGQERGDIAAGVNVQALARFVNGVLQGAAVLARGQQSPEVVTDLLEKGFESFKVLTQQ